MNQSLSSIIAKLNLAKVMALFKRYRVILFIVSLALIYSFLVFRINSLTSQQPDPTAVAGQLKTLGSPRIDPSVVAKIEQLQDNSSQVKSLFNNARKNPFVECLDREGKVTVPPNCVNNIE